MSYSEEFLAHYGVKGMKWGVIRSAKQLSAAAKSKGDSPTTSKVKGKSSTETSDKKKKISDYSDEELNKIVKRLELEKRMKTLEAESTPIPFSARAKDIVSKSLTAASADVLRKVAIYYLGQAVNNAAGKTIVSSKSEKKKEDSNG